MDAYFSRLAAQVFFLVFKRGDAGDFFKVPVKIGYIIKTAFKTDDIGRYFVFDEQFAGLADPDFV